MVISILSLPSSEALMRLLPSVLAAAAIALLVNSYGLAAQPDSPGLGREYDGSKGVPGPVAGAGLSFLLLAGGAAVLYRYRKRSRSR